jgi:hypothetical protein
LVCSAAQKQLKLLKNHLSREMEVSLFLMMTAGWSLDLDQCQICILLTVTPLVGTELKYLELCLPNTVPQLILDLCWGIQEAAQNIYNPQQ